MSSQKGANYERDLVRLLDDLGYAVMRSPASGAATKRNQPDLLVGRAHKIRFRSGRLYSDAMALELKSGKQTTLYVDSAEVEALESFASDFGATPYLVARSTRRDIDQGFYFIPPENARMTDGGNYGLPMDSLEDRAEVVFRE